MKFFLNIALALFLIFIIINATQIDYRTSLLTDPNYRFLYSGLAGVIGIIVVFIVKQLRLLNGKH